jgi:hypothetical protein
MLATVTIYVQDREYEVYKTLCARSYRTEADQLGFSVNKLYQAPRPLDFRPRSETVRPHQIRVSPRVSYQLEHLAEQYNQAASRIAEALVIEMAAHDSDDCPPKPNPHPQYVHAQ